MQLILAASWFVAAGIFIIDAWQGWPKLLISNDGNIRLAEPKINSTGTVAGDNATTENLYHLSTLYEYADYASPFDVAVEERKMFFVRPGARKNHGVMEDTLVAADVDRSKKVPKVLLKHFFPTTDGIAVDWVTKKLYLCDAETRRIGVLDYGHHSDPAKPLMTILIYKELIARSLVVDPVRGYIFWLNDYSETTIERAWMDGTHRRVLLQEQDFANSLTIDSEEGKLYWTVLHRTKLVGSIWSSTIDGRNRTRISAEMPRPYSISAIANMLLWSHVSESRSGVYYCEKQACGQGNQLIRRVRPFAFRIFDTRLQASRQNPCAVNNGNCSHLCFLTPQLSSQRNCACPVGVKMLDDGVTCSDGPEEIIITAQRDSIRVISLDTPDYTYRRIPIDQITHAVSVDYDSLEGYVYWLDTAMQMIRRVKLDGSGEEDVVVGISDMCEDLAVDWIAKNIYWTDASAGRIEVARIGQQATRRILLSSDIQKPRAIIVDPPRGYIFWTDLSEASPRIEKAFLDGSNRVILVQFESGQWPNGLALDALAGHIYWVDAKWDTLERANAADGYDRITLWEHKSSHAWGVTILGNYVYWSDMQHRSLEKLSKNKGGDRTLLSDDLTGIMHIKGVNLKHTPGDTNECGVRNGGCSHFCFYRPTGRICMCPLGWELDVDGMRCQVPEGYLVFTRKKIHDIMIASLSRFPTSLDYLRLHNVSQPFSLDFHYKQRRLYWTGYEGDKIVIARAYMNGSNVETVVDYGLIMGESLAVDWLAEQMYWSDAGYNHIEMARMNGQSRKIIIWDDVRPGALVVSPLAGHLYWVNLKGSHTIERSGLDGRNRVKFLPRVGRVTSLAMDHVDSRLYWSSSDDGTISFVEISRNLYPQVLVSERLMQPYSLTLFGDRLYWADWHKQTIQMCDKTNSANATVLYSNQHLVKSLTAVHALKQPGWNGCSNGQHECQHLCFAIPYAPHHHSFRCDCPTHFTLSSDDGRSCSPPSSFVLFVQDSLLRRFQITDHVFDGPVATLPFKNLSNVICLKYDPLNRMIYWMEKDNKTVSIRRVRENEGEVETLLFQPNLSPIDFALDVTTQTIFWTSVHNDDAGDLVYTVNVNKILDGGMKFLGSIIAESGFSPRFITVDPLRGFLFFIDWHSKKSSIVRCRLDGTECARLFSAEDGEFQSLNLDLDNGALFWYNTKSGSIGRINSDGSNYQSDFVPHVTGGLVAMTVFKSRLYYVDAKTNAVMNVDKIRGLEKRELVMYQRITDVKALLAVDDTITKRLKSMDPCAYAKCTHICYVTNGVDDASMEAKCGCPTGKKLQKTNNGASECIVDRPPCRENEWHCGDSVCIDRRRVCNGFTDCVNGGSDEKNCTCIGDQRKCRDGQVRCVWYDQQCYGVKNCSDGSAETFCPPSTSHKTVNNGVSNFDHSDKWNNALNIVIYLVAAAMVSACVVYAAARWYRHGSLCGQKRHEFTARTDGATLELRVLHPLNERQQPAANTTTTTTVEYSATCRVTHYGHSDASDQVAGGSSSISPLPPPLEDVRPQLTGKSSSSSSNAAISFLNTSHQGPKNPPPTLVTIPRNSSSPDSVTHAVRQSRRQRRNRRRHRDRRSDQDLEYAPAIAGSEVLRERNLDSRAPLRTEGLYYYNHQMYSPPPPYDDCEREQASGTTNRAATNIPLLHEDTAENDTRRYSEECSNDVRNVGWTRRPTNGSKRRRNTSGKSRSVASGAPRPPPSSPCSSDSLRYENPPPTPVPRCHHDSASSSWNSDPDAGK